MKPAIYLDYAATTPIADEVLDVMLPFLTDHFANPSSPHAPGRKVQEVLDEARTSIKRNIGGAEGQLFFTGCATESINTILKSFLPFQNQGRAPHIITSYIEHKAVLSTCSFMGHFGAKITKLPVTENGLINPELVRQAINSETSLVCIQWVNNETGTIQNIVEIGEICKERKVLFMVDAVQGAGKLHIDAAKCNSDFLVISAHKFAGPKGVGAHFVSEKGMKVLKPLLHGGGQEDDRRGGTHNVAGIIGMAKALDIACLQMDAEWERLSAAMAAFLVRLQQHVPGIVINARNGLRVPNILNLKIEDVEHFSLINKLNDILAIGVGSACQSSLSYVLEALGLSEVEIRNSIRVSVGRFTTESQLMVAADEIAAKILQIRKQK